MKVGRRTMIGAVVGGLSLNAAPALLAARPATGPLDYDKAQDRLKAYMLMRGALDERLVIGSLTGSYFGVVDDEITPLWDVVSATFSRYRRRADGGYDGFTGEVAYFIDPQTRKAPGRFHNPYTGEMIDEPRQGYPPSKILIGADLNITLGKGVPGLTIDHHVKPTLVRANDVWMPELTISAMTLPGVAKPLRYSESIIMHARRSDLETPGVKRVATDVNFTNFVGWRPWMNMGDRPGHLTAVGTGATSDTMDSLPLEWIAATRDKRPELLDDPGKLIEALWQAG